MKHKQRIRAKGFDAINRLRLLYRMADGDEATLREEIIALSLQHDYDPECNALLFSRGFGCWCQVSANTRARDGAECRARAAHK